MFDNIAPKYDLLNHILSLGIDRHWRKKLINKINPSIPSPQILDIASGTADLAISTKKKLPHALITGSDISQKMIDIAKTKTAKLNLDIKFLTADAENLPFPNNHFNATICSFGARNFENLQAGINEMYRVLKPQSQLLILEFSIPKNSLFAKLFKFYFHKILPIIGGWISGDKNAYTYLPLSVDKFPSGQNFLNHLTSAGFIEPQAQPLTFGVATIYSAIKP